MSNFVCPSQNRSNDLELKCFFAFFDTLNTLNLNYRVEIRENSFLCIFTVSIIIAILDTCFMAWHTYFWVKKSFPLTQFKELKLKRNDENYLFSVQCIDSKIAQMNLTNMFI